MNKIKAILLVVLLLFLNAGVSYSQYQPPPPPPPTPGQSVTPLPPVSIMLTPVPNSIPPGGSGVLIVQLVDRLGIPEPARNSVSISLFTSDPSIVTVQGEVSVPFGKSHVEVPIQAHLEGKATITAMANGFSSGFTDVSVDQFPGFSLSITPLMPVALPGDTVWFRVDLLASGSPFIAPIPIGVTFATDNPEVPIQTVNVQQGSSYAYSSFVVPQDINVTKISSITLTVATNGFTSSKATVQLSQPNAKQSNATEPASLKITATPFLLSQIPGQPQQFISVSLSPLNSSVPVRGSLTVYLFSSNLNVVRILKPYVVFGNNDSMLVPVAAVSSGSAQVTAVAQGVNSTSVPVSVVSPVRATLSVSSPQTIRAGEAYSFSVGFYYNSEPAVLGPATVYASSSDAIVNIQSPIQVSQLGYGTGTVMAESSAVSTVTVSLNGFDSVQFGVNAVFSPVVVKVVYSVTAVSMSGALPYMDINFTYAGTTKTVQTDSSGTATFTAYNDTAVTITVPQQFSFSNRTYYFTDWSTGYKNNTIQVLSPSQVFSIKAQYFRGVFPATYSVFLESEAGPIQGAIVNFTYSGKTFSVVSGASGTASFSAYNDSAVLISVPRIVKENNRTYYFTGWSNGASGSTLQVLSKTQLFAITAQYFRSVVPVDYTFQVLADGGLGVAGLQIVVGLGGKNVSLTTDQSGMAKLRWYNGTEVTVYMPQVYQQSQSVKYQFLNANNQTNNVFTFSSPGPAYINARYATYYYVSVSSEFGTATGSGWYRYGSSAPYSVSPTSVGGPFISQRFVGWEGTFSSFQASGVITVSGPVTLVAQWATDESLLYLSIAGVLGLIAAMGLFFFRFRKKEKVVNV